MLNTLPSLSLCQPTLLCSNHHYSHLTPGNQLSPATHPALIETQSYRWLFINDRTLRRAVEGGRELNSKMYTFLAAVINLNYKCDDWTIFAVSVKMFAFAAGLIRTDRFCLCHWHGLSTEEAANQIPPHWRFTCVEHIGHVFKVNEDGWFSHIRAQRCTVISKETNL